MNKPVRIAVIGAGRWGKNILKTLATLPGCEVAYSVTRDYKPLFEKDDIDAVVVATPPATHAAIALPFIKKGLPVFIEKPLTLDSKEGSQLETASKKSKAPIFVGHIHLYNPAYEALKKLIGKAGKLHMLVGEGASNGPFRDDYSAMWDWAPHDLSMMLDIAGKPSSVQAWGVVSTRKNSRLHDFSIMKLNFPSGAVGVIHSSKLSPEKRRKFTVIGSKNSITYDDTLQENKVTLFEGHGPTISGKNKKIKVQENQPALSYPSYESASPLTRELEAFVEMVKTKKKPRADLKSGIEVVKILEAAEKSILAGGTVVKI
jgi:UDP-N-acetylglucosamine 3-dehydrogenase